MHVEDDWLGRGPVVFTNAYAVPLVILQTCPAPFPAIGTNADVLYLVARHS